MFYNLGEICAFYIECNSSHIYYWALNMPGTVPDTEIKMINKTIPVFKEFMDKKYSYNMVTVPQPSNPMAFTQLSLLRLLSCTRKWLPQSFNKHWINLNKFLSNFPALISVAYHSPDFFFPHRLVLQPISSHLFYWFFFNPLSPRFCFNLCSFLTLLPSVNSFILKAYTVMSKMYSSSSDLSSKLLSLISKCH